MYASSEFSKLDLIQARISQQMARGPDGGVETEIKIIPFPVNHSWLAEAPWRKTISNLWSLQILFLIHHHNSPRVFLKC